MTSIYEQAMMYTFDQNIINVLKGCIKGKWPPQFKVSRGYIETTKGNRYKLPNDPMELCNLVHDIISGQEISMRNNIPAQSKSIRKSNRNNTGLSDDAIYSFAKRETQRLGKDEYHKEQLQSCIFTAIFLKRIDISDFVLDKDKIISIKGIDTENILITSEK
jgi:hypothetical protein